MDVQVWSSLIHYPFCLTTGWLGPLYRILGGKFLVVFNYDSLKLYANVFLLLITRFIPQNVHLRCGFVIFFLFFKSHGIIYLSVSQWWLCHLVANSRVLFLPVVPAWSTGYQKPWLNHLSRCSKLHVFSNSSLTSKILLDLMRRDIRPLLAMLCLLIHLLTFPLPKLKRFTLRLWQETEIYRQLMSMNCLQTLLN